MHVFRLRWSLLSGVCILCACEPNDDAGVDADSVKLGLYANLQDVSADEANVSLAYQAVREINDAGGLAIAGVEVTLDLEVADHGGSGASAAEATEMLFDAGVKAVIGPPWSSHLLGDEADHSDGAAAVAIERGLVMVSQSATSPAVTDLDDDGLVFRTMPSDLVQASVAADEIWSRQLVSAGILYRDDAYGQGLSRAFQDEFETEGGEVVAAVSYDVSGGLDELLSYSFDDELMQVFELGPDVVYLICFEEFAQISARIAAGGYQDDGVPTYFGTDAIYDPSTIRSGNEAVVWELSGTAPGAPIGEPGYGRFVDRLAEEGLGEPWYGAPHLYDAIYLVAYAMQRADSVDPRRFKQSVIEVSRNGGGDHLVGVAEFAEGRERLLAGEDIDYDGASGPLDLTEAGDPGTGWYVIWEVVEGEGGLPSLDSPTGVRFDLEE